MTTEIDTAIEVLDTSLQSLDTLKARQLKLLEGYEARVRDELDDVGNIGLSWTYPASSYLETAHTVQVLDAEIINNYKAAMEKIRRVAAQLEDNNEVVEDLKEQSLQLNADINRLEEEKRELEMKYEREVQRGRTLAKFVEETPAARPVLKPVVIKVPVESVNQESQMRTVNSDSRIESVNANSPIGNVNTDSRIESVNTTSRVLRGTEVEAILSAATNGLTRYHEMHEAGKLDPNDPPPTIPNADVETSPIIIDANGLPKKLSPQRRQMEVLLSTLDQKFWDKPEFRPSLPRRPYPDTKLVPAGYRVCALCFTVFHAQKRDENGKLVDLTPGKTLCETCRTRLEMIQKQNNVSSAERPPYELVSGLNAKTLKGLVDNYQDFIDQPQKQSKVMAWLDKPNA